MNSMNGKCVQEDVHRTWSASTRQQQKDRTVKSTHACKQIWRNWYAEKGMLSFLLKTSAMSSAISGNAQRLNSHSFHSSDEGPWCDRQCITVGFAAAADLLCVASGTGSQDDAAGALAEAAFDDDERMKPLSCLWACLLSYLFRLRRSLSFCLPSSERVRKMARYSGPSTAVIGDLVSIRNWGTWVSWSFELRPKSSTVKSLKSICSL